MWLYKEYGIVNFHPGHVNVANIPFDVQIKTGNIKGDITIDTDTEAAIAL
jgi:hypothetical protein